MILREKIKCRIDEIENNPGKRFASKLLMNSFYGKLGQSTKKNSYITEYLTEPDQLRKLMNNPNSIVNFIHFVNVRILSFYNLLKII